MKRIEYSVIIRTTGKAHEKYQKLLDSIEALSVKPEEVIVVLPEGYDLPQEKLGYETFFFCKKGMVKQRLAGVECCKTRYALICDDDIAFGPDFVEKIYRPIEKGIACFSAAPLYSFLPPKGFNAVFCALNGSAVPTLFHQKDRYVSVLKTSGYSYNRHLDTREEKYYETQSVPWTCFFADIEAFKKLELEKEIWLDAHGYSALDDQTMFYKAWLLGLKTVVVSNAYYEHLDGKTSTRNNNQAVLYSHPFNRVVFWHRFIFMTQNSTALKIIARIAFFYRRLWMLVWNKFELLRKRINYSEYKISEKGYTDGWKYIKSEEYKTLPTVRMQKEFLTGSGNR